MWTSIILLALLFLEIIAVYFSWRAIKSARTPQGSVGWVVFLISAPYIAVPVYLFLGHHKYAGYINARRDNKTIRTAIADWGEKLKPVETRSTISPTVFEQIADMPAIRGNTMRLLIDGDETFDTLFAAIAEAQKYVLVQYYIVHDDEVGQALKSCLIDAAKRGVTVRMMVDAVGSHKLPKSFLKDLTDGGVDIVDPKSVRGARSRFHLNFRNHRKTVVVDGHKGFTGGLNVGREYKGLDPEFGPWRDTHAVFEGPIVCQLQIVFAEDWFWATDTRIVDELVWDTEGVEDDMTALLVPTGPGDIFETGSLMFFSAITAARSRIWIASPYFVPDIDILTALKEAAMRDVDVRILVPDAIDHKIPWLAAFAYFDEVIEAGCKVLRYTDGFMHQKAFLVDNDIAAVGTTNMDNRSFRLNFETMALMFDARAAGDMEQMLLADFSKAFQLKKPLAKQRLKIRIGAPIARLFAPLL